MHGCLHTALALCAAEAEVPCGGLLSRITVTLIPQVSPDGADWCARTSGNLRSRPHITEQLEPNTIYPEDIDGDGKILFMRQATPDGEWVEDPLEPRLLIPRTVCQPDDHSPPTASTSLSSSAGLLALSFCALTGIFDGTGQLHRSILSSIPGGHGSPMGRA